MLIPSLRATGFESFVSAKFTWRECLSHTRSVRTYGGGTDRRWWKDDRMQERSCGLQKKQKETPPICPKTCQVFEGLLMRFPFLFPPAQTDRSWDASGLCGRARGFSTVCCVSPLTGLIRTTATDSHGHSRGGEGRCCRRQAKTRPPTSHHFLICLLTWPAITAVLHASMWPGYDARYIR